MSFTGRTAVVTGGSRGIGRAICLELARRGANVVFSYAGNTAAAEATRKELEALGVQTRAVQGSVADPAAVKTLIDTAVKELGSLDILVNNAGITRDNLAMMLKEEDFDAVIETNLKGAFLTMKAAARPMMKARYGRIVNLSSVVALRGNPGQINYCASKAGLHGGHHPPPGRAGGGHHRGDRPGQGPHRLCQEDRSRHQDLRRGDLRRFGRPLRRAERITL